MCHELKRIIISASKKIGIDPYTFWFKPSDLKIEASQYGSFSDHCLKGTTESSKYCGCGVLEADSNSHPRKYKLIK